MPTLSQVVFIRPRPGRQAAFISDVARAKKIITRCGAKMRVWNQTVGADAGATALVIETADWKGYGEYNARLQDDREWQAFLSEINSAKEPNAEIFRTLLHVEIPS
jgi:hypothetical protein